MSKALDDIKAERQRQIHFEGWLPERDDRYRNGQLAVAGASYAVSSVVTQVTGENLQECPNFWPWDKEWFKPKSPRQDLVRAAALLVAEIERLDRLEGSE